MKFCYFNCVGRYQELCDRIEKLIPSNGEASTEKLNLFRVVGNAYYDVYNNGAINTLRFKQLNPYLTEFKSELLDNGLTESDYEMIFSLGLRDDDDDFNFDYYSASMQDLFQPFERLCDASIMIAKSELS